MADTCRRFTIEVGTANKFWEILHRDGDTEVTARWGRIGTQGQSKTKRFPSVEKAQAEVKTLIAEKTGKGYQEVAISDSKARGPASSAAVPADPISALFADYESWYQKRYLKELVEDEDDEDAREEIEEQGWDKPLARLKPLAEETIKQAEASCGAFPQAYRSLLSKIGVGTLLCAMDDEPCQHEILHPRGIAKERRALLSWVSKDGIKRIQNDQGIDPLKLAPFLKADDTTWALLAMQHDGDDRVFVFDHEFEGGYKRLLCGPTPLEAFLRDYLRRAKLKNPLNGNNCWRRPRAE